MWLLAPQEDVSLLCPRTGINAVNSLIIGRPLGPLLTSRRERYTWRKDNKITAIWNTVHCLCKNRIEAFFLFLREKFATSLAFWINTSAPLETTTHKRNNTHMSKTNPIFWTEVRLQAFRYASCICAWGWTERTVGGEETGRKKRIPETHDAKWPEPTEQTQKILTRLYCYMAVFFFHYLRKHAVFSVERKEGRNSLRRDVNRISA